MRTYTMSHDDRVSFDPQKLFEAMKAAGFVFETDGCPFKIKKPWDTVKNPDGSFTYRQWDDGEAVSRRGRELLAELSQ